MQIAPEQAQVILVSVFGLMDEDAQKITSSATTISSSKKFPDLTNPLLIDSQDNSSTPQPSNGPETAEELKAELQHLEAIVTQTAAMQAKVQVLPSKTQAFTMKDDPDYQLSDKELDMVTKAIGLKNKPAKKKKA